MCSFPLLKFNDFNSSSFSNYTAHNRDLDFVFQLFQGSSSSPPDTLKSLTVTRMIT